VIVHRAICGSIERMLGILIEHFQGKFPVWLSPRQIAIIPVATKPEFKEYCEKIKQSLTDFDPRLDSIKVFDSHETFDYRIRDAETKLYNYVLIIGKKEIDTNSVTFRIINHKRNDIKMVPLMIYVNKSKSHTMILLLIKQNISSLHFVSIKPITSLL
jgi:threonyl-tRNA synthetase